MLIPPLRVSSAHAGNVPLPCAHHHPYHITVIYLHMGPLLREFLGGRSSVSFSFAIPE